MVKVLFDTNVLIDYLNGIEQAKNEFARYSDKAISLITRMEVLVGATSETEPAIRHFLNEFSNIKIDDQVSDLAVSIRKQHKIKLPDAIIWATALTQNRLLITRNTKDFSANEPGIYVPYQI
jgi:predicted nucleic acid-binding protein